MKGLLVWMGGKWCLAEEIIPRFPTKYAKYVEVFGGGGSILFARKKTDKVEVYNDFNKHLVNLFQVVKERPFEFLHELDVYNLNSRHEFSCLYKFLNNERIPYTYLNENIALAKEMLPPLEEKEFVDLLTRKAEDRDLMQAVNYFKLISYSFAAGGKSYNSQPSKIVNISNHIYKCSERLRKVNIENKDFEGLIKQHDAEESFFYCDPPYYKAEYYEASFNEQDHHRLKNVLSNIKGKFLLSYNDCPFIRDLYKDFCIVSVERNNFISNKSGSIYKEVLIANYDIQEKNQDAYAQLEFIYESEETNE
ncbi:DNA adenine methylase [Anaerorhabdus sp.]|uniref:DNA adenine methylase n=1 Tax=Anaerorhabdus sp. TaxID=1872524 RepID=UPI002FC9676E